MEKNKWLNQKIHKKYNKIQYASKHYGDNDNKLIFKRKHPLKQRKDRKQFKTQRNRKKVYKCMAFDYNDFMFKNMKENAKRIQIRPTTQYSHDDIYDIESMYYDYYAPDDDDIETYFVDKRYHGNIDGVIVNIELFYAQCFAEDKLGDRRDRDNAWNWTRNIPRNQREENDIVQRAIAVSLQTEYMPYHEKLMKASSSHCKLRKIRYAATTIKVYGNSVHYPTHHGHQLSGLSAEKIAINTWNLYKYNLKLNQCNIYNTMMNQWKVTKQNDLDSVALEHILDVYIPFLWSMYQVIFDFMGYDSFKILKISANMHLLHKNEECVSSTKHNGIRYYDKRTYSKRRRYSDYDHDIKSYIPTDIYYKRHDDNTYHEIGDYDKTDWNTLTYFSRTKKRIQRNKRKPPQVYTDVCSLSKNVIQNSLLRCPCGCGRKITQRSRKGARLYKSILEKRDCVNSNHGYRWKGYRRNKSKHS